MSNVPTAPSKYCAKAQLSSILILTGRLNARNVISCPESYGIAIAIYPGTAVAFMLASLYTTVGMLE